MAVELKVHCKTKKEHILCTKIVHLLHPLQREGEDDYIIVHHIYHAYVS